MDTNFLLLVIISLESHGEIGYPPTRALQNFIEGKEVVPELDLEKKWIEFGSIEMGGGHSTDKEYNEQRPRSEHPWYGWGEMNRLHLALI